MSENSWNDWHEGAINEASREGVGAPSTALEHKQPSKEAVHMSRCGYNGDSTPKYNPEQSENWQSIGELAARLVRK